MGIVFAHTRAHYASYTDYVKLVELAGFKTCFVDHISYASENVYIVSPLNGEYRPFRDAQREGEYNARVIWWSLERPGFAEGMAPFRRGTKKLLDDWYFDEVWIPDKFLQSELHDERTRFVILGSHAGLGTLRREEQEYAFAHMSYQNGRRGGYLGQFTARGIPLAPNGWGEERHKALMRSKFMLNIHQDDWPIIEPLRFALAAAYGLPLITEYCKDAYPYTRQGEGHYVVQATAEELVGKATVMLNDDYAWWKAMGLRCHSAMTGEFGFRRMVEQAVQGLPMPSTVEIV